MNPTLKALLLVGLGAAGGVVISKLIAGTGLPVLGIPPRREVSEGAPPLRRIMEDVVNACDQFRPVAQQFIAATGDSSEAGTDLSTGELYAIYRQLERLT